jgi:hypothetical protein
LSASKYKEKFCKEIVEHMADGKSFETFAARVSVSKATIYAWLEKYPDFKEAREVALMKCLAWWEKQAMEHLIEITGPGNKKLNVGLYFINMRNRFGWKGNNAPDAPPGESENDNELLAMWGKTKSER